MNDSEIIARLTQRDETVLEEAAKQYGGSCRALALRLLRDPRDAEECVNDAMLRLWDTVPPAQPESMYAYLSTIVRNLACDRLRSKSRLKRGGDSVSLALDELADCLPSGDSTEAELDSRELGRAIEAFLDAQTKERRIIFMQRYWAMMSVREIAQRYQLRENTVKSTLKRMRDRLADYLKKEGFL